MLALDGEHQFGVETADAGMPLQDGDIFANIVLLIRNASRPELARASNRSQKSREVLIHLSIEDAVD